MARHLSPIRNDEAVLCSRFVLLNIRDLFSDECGKKETQSNLPMFVLTHNGHAVMKSASTSANYLLNEAEANKWLQRHR